jgi:hypothetical protein
VNLSAFLWIQIIHQLVTRRMTLEKSELCNVTNCHLLLLGVQNVTVTKPNKIFVRSNNHTSLNLLELEAYSKQPPHRCY